MKTADVRAEGLLRLIENTSCLSMTMHNDPRDLTCYTTVPGHTIATFAALDTDNIRPWR
jgi:hypothetical protein